MLESIPEHFSAFPSFIRSSCVLWVYFLGCVLVSFAFLLLLSLLQLLALSFLQQIFSHPQLSFQAALLAASADAAACALALTAVFIAASSVFLQSKLLLYNASVMLSGE
jgi:hypothetical protein